MDDWVSGLGNYWEFHGDKIAMIQDSDDKKCFWFEDGQVPEWVKVVESNKDLMINL
jgi:hypothetical protein